MKIGKHYPISIASLGTNCERQVQQEIETYLNALHSYPDRAAREPYLSFEQHLFSLSIASQFETRIAGQPDLED